MATVHSDKLEDTQQLQEKIASCQAAYNELYQRNVRLYEELTAAHEIIERLQRSEVTACKNLMCHHTSFIEGS